MATFQDLIQTPSEPRVERPKQVKQGSSFKSMEMMTMLKNGLVLARRVMGQTHTMAFPDEIYAPRNHTKDDDKFYIVGDGTLAGVPGANNKIEFQAPWYVSEGFSIVGALVVLRTNTPRPLSIVMTSDDLISAVASTASRASAAVNPQTDGYAVQGNYRAPGETVKAYGCAVQCFLRPTLPANREVKLTFSLKWLNHTGENSSFSFGNYQDYVTIQSVAVWDHPDQGDIG